MTTETREGTWHLSDAGDFILDEQNQIVVEGIGYDGWFKSLVAAEGILEGIVSDHNDAARYRAALERIAEGPSEMIGDTSDVMWEMAFCARDALAPQPEQAG